MACTVRSVRPTTRADIPDAGLGVAGDLHQHVPVAGQQCPDTAALVRVAHALRAYNSRVGTREIDHVKFFSRLY